MPWTPEDAKEKNKLVTSDRLAKIWTDVANSALKQYKDEGRAIATANSVIKKLAKTNVSESTIQDALASILKQDAPNTHKIKLIDHMLSQLAKMTKTC